MSIYNYKGNVIRDQIHSKSIHWCEALQKTNSKTVDVLELINYSSVNTHCLTDLFLHNQSPKNLAVKKTTVIYYSHSFCGLCMWEKLGWAAVTSVSHEVPVEVLTKAAVIYRLNWGWRSHFQGVSPTWLTSWFLFIWVSSCSSLYVFTPWLLASSRTKDLRNQGRSWNVFYGLASEVTHHHILYAYIGQLWVNTGENYIRARITVGPLGGYLLYPYHEKNWDHIVKIHMHLLNVLLLKIMLESETKTIKRQKESWSHPGPSGKIFITSSQSLNRNLCGWIGFRIQNFLDFRKVKR